MSGEKSRSGILMSLRWTNLRAQPRRVFQLTREEQGQSLVEFGLALPLVIVLLMGMLAFGVAYSNYLSLNHACFNGAQALTISRGQTTNPCTTTSTPVFSAAPTLKRTDLKFTITITSSGGSTTTLASGTPSPSCSGSAYTGALVAGSQASVTLTYPCNLKILGHDFAPNCSLTSQTSEVVQ